MSFLQGKTKRRILPRWRSSQRASNSSEFTSQKGARAIKFSGADHLQEVTHAFRRAPTVGTAAEVLSASILAGQTAQSDAAAKFVLQHPALAPLALLKLANSIADTGQTHMEASTVGSNTVAQTRVLLRIAPANPMLWSDMARHFASQGDKKRAMRCMQTAQQLAPDHRWFLRTMARFLVHQEDPVAAHKLLAAHPRTRTDPWLMAAEIACAQVAGRAPKHWNKANDVLRFDSAPPNHISELATAVAMLELESGKRKRARKLVQKGLLVPTENTLAQVLWAQENRHLGEDVNLSAMVRSASDAYEAGFQLNLIQGDVVLALAAATTWKDDEPFAARPRSEIAYIASVLDDHELTIQMAKEVIQLDGHTDDNLEMNRVFAVLSSGRLTAAQDSVEIERIAVQLREITESGGSETFHAVANFGLWHYRYGNVGKGRAFYSMAVNLARKVGVPTSAAMAAVFAAREAILARQPDAWGDLQLARDLVNRASTKVGEFYLRKLDALIADPTKAAEILTPKTASRFLAVSSGDEPLAFERTKTGYVLLLSKAK